LTPATTARRGPSSCWGGPRRSESTRTTEVRRHGRGRASATGGFWPRRALAATSRFRREGRRSEHCQVSLELAEGGLALPHSDLPTKDAQADGVTQLVPMERSEGQSLGGVLQPGQRLGRVVVRDVDAGEKAGVSLGRHGLVEVCRFPAGAPSFHPPTAQAARVVQGDARRRVNKAGRCVLPRRHPRGAPCPRKYA
jgi:hypothetical protein